MRHRPTNSRKEQQVNHSVPAPRPPATPEPRPPDGDRAARVAELRRAWLEGRLDLTVTEESPGFDRLLDELLER